MEEEGLSKVDAWRLVNVILRLYKVIANCYDLCNLYIDKKSLVLKKWIDKDKEIVNYFRKPQRYGYGTNVSVQLSDHIFEKLYKFIIEENDFPLAMDFIQPKLHLNNLIHTMRTVEENANMKFSSIDFMVSLRDFRSEIYKWAAVYSSRINSTIDKEMAKRKIMTYSLLCEAKSNNNILEEETNQYAIADKNSFELSDFFIDEYDSQCINRIYQFLTFLNSQKGPLYIAKISSIIAIAWENHLLCDTYNNTLQAVFNHFGITDKIDNYKPARLRKSNYKGNIPLARVQAIKFFQSIDNRVSVH
ncbi:MAG TPA: hypothetical protein PLQ69_06085 [Paludibacter sp.]|nr:hypothetical protein [Salinivirgaceae bacterium]HOS46029.1 hypothetical protein [Paludibacter sp.]HPM10104.1 hypothetical protein [Paludibacter sp.]